MKISIYKLLALLSLVLASGCTVIAPFPLAARAGDTITLAVGSQDGMNRTNTTVTFTSDSDGIPVDISSNIQSIFNLYAEKSTNLYSPNIQFYHDNFKYLHHEPWQTVILLNLPTTGLALGPGVVNVTTTLPQPFGPLEPGPFGTYPDLNTVDIGLEILAGTGTKHLFRYKTIFNGTLSGNTNELQPGRQVLVRPPKSDAGSLWTNTFGAIEMVINLPMTDLGSDGLDDSSIRMVTQDVSMYTGSKPQLIWSFDGTDLTVMFISSTGKLQYYEPRFSVVAELDDFSANGTITSVTYYDIDGNTMTGPGISDYGVSLIGTY
jgi:hypothetical protein